MESIISSIITPVIQSLMVPVKKHLGFLVSSTKYVKDIKEKMDQLNLTEQDVQKNLDEAIEKNHRVPRQVMPWLEKVKEMKSKAQSIPTGGVGCLNVAKRYKTGKQSYNILKEIQDLETRKSKIVFTKEQIPLAEIASTSTGPSIVGTQNNFESRELIYKAALESLQSNDESHNMIALCGMGGVGKTTMMEQLKKEVEASKVFDRVVKVVIGENSDPISLQRAIAKNIDLEDLKEETKDARADRLCNIFGEMSKQGKKNLVIMDDLWSEIDLKVVGLSPLPKGFKMLFTSRDKSYCIRTGVRSNSIFKVGFLIDAEAKALFFGIVGLSNGDDPSFRKIGEDILKKCGGLPIAIVTIAKNLSDNIKEAWEKALWRLEKDDLKDLESITHRIFEMSYENLKEDDKAIFLLSGLFPDDYYIHTEDLLRYGWGLGFYKDAKTLTMARSDMKICVNNLIRANLLTESDLVGCVKMHDLVRAFVLSNFSNIKQASIVNHDNIPEQLTKDANDSYDRVLLKCTGMSEFPNHFNYPNLSMLMLMDGCGLLKFPKDVYQRMGKLEVLSYEKMHLPLLQVASEHLTKLRTLSLHKCSFINDDISFLGSLHNLEILSIVECRIAWFPSTIGKLKGLKLLDLTGCVNLHIGDGVFQNLSSLEELYMRAYHDSPIRFTDTNCVELELLSHRLIALELEFFKNKAQPKNMSFEKLKRFRISIGCHLAELDYEEEYSFRNTIQFSGDCDELLECKISDLFEITEELHLTVNGMNHFEDHLFSNLTVLHVSECADLIYLFTVDVASSLKRLERLTISKCPVLKTFVSENSRGVIRFPKLNYMSLIGLPQMVRFWDNEIELPEMVELIVDGLPNFTSIYPYSHNTFEMQSLLNKKVVIPKLKKLDISRMVNLKHIWSCEVTTEKNNLFPSSPLALLNHLEELKVKECGSIEVLFNIDLEGVSGIVELGCRLRSIEVDNLGKLKVLWRMKGVNKSSILINCFKGVESIEIINCYEYNTRNAGKEILKGEITELNDYIPKVTYPSYLLHTCHHLRHLKLRNDKRVEEVVFDMDTQPPPLLPCLETIHLQDLKELSHVWKCKNWNKLILHHQPPPLQFPFQNLRDILLWRCHKIKYLFSPLMAKYLSNLKRVDISWCDGIEEVISRRDDEENSTSASSYQDTTLFFPHLDTLYLSSLPCLESVDKSQSGQVTGACWSLCQYPTNIYITECDALSSLIPWYALGQMERLQELVINECSRMTEVFNINVDDEGGAHGTSPTTLKNINPQFSNLKKVDIVKCDLLSHLFTFSALESLKQLEKLRVISCKAIQVIVKEENSTAGGIKSSKDHVMVFPRLKTLELDNLPNLKGFFLGMNIEFQWPLLDNVKIDGCPELMMFTSGHSKAPKLKYIGTRLGRHSPECGINFNRLTINEYQTTFPNSSSSSSELAISNGMPWSFHNLIQINRFGSDVGRASIIPFNVLPQLQKLQQISIKFCGGVKEVFEVVALELEGSGFNESVKIPNLTQLELEHLFDLKYLWKSNQWMVLEFPNLTTVDISHCRHLEHVFTCSMVGSLVQLQDLKIRQCSSIEVIVKEEEECDAKVNNEIILPRLKSLKLEGLQSLKGFCLGKEEAFSLPALDSLEISYCRVLTVFTKGQVATPELKVIDAARKIWEVVFENRSQLLYRDQTTRGV